MKFEISQEEINELLKEKFQATIEINEGKLTISAMMGTVKFTLLAPKTPVEFAKEIEMKISMSLTVRIFLDRIKDELKKRNLNEAISITPNLLKIDITKMENNPVINWLKGKTLKKMKLENEKMYLEIA